MGKSRRESRIKRHRRIRKKVAGTTERPRLAVFGSLKNIYAQVIDDSRGHTLVSASTLEKELKGKVGHGGNAEAARMVGEILARKSLDKGVKKVVFDRGGFMYHGRISAFADAAREGGLEF